MDIQDLLEGFVIEYEDLFGKNVRLKIDEISDNQMQNFISRWQFYLTTMDVKLTLKIDNPQCDTTRLINTKLGAASILEYCYLLTKSKISNLKKLQI